MATRIGIVENVQRAHFFVREIPGWAKYFASVEDCDDGAVPQQGARVEFSPYDGDPRGPRVALVTVLADPPPDTVETCCDCGNDFVITAICAAWFEAKSLALPRRCFDCRQARRATT